MRKFFGFGSSTPPPPSPGRPPSPPSRPASPSGEARPSAIGPPLVGRWKEPKGSDTTEFHPDGTVTEKPAGIRGQYVLVGETLKIRLEGVPDELIFSAVIKAGVLEMKGPDGQATRYEKIS